MVRITEGDQTTSSGVTQVDYSHLSVGELETVMRARADTLQTAQDTWGHLHDVLAGFLGQPANGQEPIDFPRLVASLQGWKGAAADEFRKYANAIVDLARRMMQVAGAESGGGTFKGVTADLHHTATSAQG